MDVYAPQQVERAFARAVELADQIEIMLNNVGSNGPVAPERRLVCWRLICLSYAAISDISKEA